MHVQQATEGSHKLCGCGNVFFFNLEEMCGSISNTFTLNYKLYKGHTICKGPPMGSLSCLNAWVNSNLMLKVEKAYFMWEVHCSSSFYHQKLARFPNILELMLHCSANPKVLTPCHGSPDNAKKKNHTLKTRKKNCQRQTFQKMLAILVHCGIQDGGFCNFVSKFIMYFSLVDLNMSQSM